MDSERDRDWRWTAGSTSHAVSSAVDHESFKTMAESFAKREAVAGRSRNGGWRCSPEGSWRREAAASSTPRRTTPIVPQSFPEPYFQSELKKFRSAFVELNGIEPSASSMPFRGEPKKNE